MFIRLTDVTDPQRTADVDARTTTAIVGNWLAADGSGSPSHLVTSLELALLRSDWRAVHRIADHLSLSVEVL